MRIITIDNGNTNPHVGIFINDKLESIIPLKDFSPLDDDFILLSDVGAALPFAPSFDLKSMRKTKDNLNTFFDMPVHYANSLGDDRLIASYSVFKDIKSSEKVLLIDAGTFITMDLISEKGFLGGYIFPGLNVFLSTYQQGQKLFVPEIKNEVLNLGLPSTTEDAILKATDCYLESILESIINKTSPNKIVLTGGSSEFVKNKILKFNLLEVQLETYHHLIHLSLYSIFQNHLRSKVP